MGAGSAGQSCSKLGWQVPVEKEFWCAHVMEGGWSHWRSVTSPNVLTLTKELGRTRGWRNLLCQGMRSGLRPDGPCTLCGRFPSIL